MQGYSGFHKKKSNLGTTLVVVGLIHVAAAGGLWYLSTTEFGQELIKVYKLNMAQTKEEPPPEPEPEPEPEQPPPPKQETPPPPAPKTAEAPPPSPVKSADRPPPPTSSDSGNLFAIGKSRGKFAGYADILTSMIQAQYQEPPGLPKGLPYAVLCELILDENGYILAYKLLNSSGSAVFDQSAVEALAKLTQVRPPPEGMGKNIVVKFYPPT